MQTFLGREAERVPLTGKIGGVGDDGRRSPKLPGEHGGLHVNQIWAGSGVEKVLET